MASKKLISFDSSKIVLTDKCTYCSSRIWYKDEYEYHKEKVYQAPKAFKKLFEETIGKYTLGSYVLRRCEVCGKSMAIFFEPSGVLKDKVFVLYSCTLMGEPKDMAICEGRKNCYNCPSKGNGPGGL
jgi:DNA-directed RNA polymerase subunit RPC12/RpoP